MQIKEGDKLYIVVRKDLNPGQIAVQAMHSMMEWIKENLELAFKWHENSNYICLLWIENEIELLKLFDLAIENNIKVTYFKESNLNNSLTAICLEPGEKSKKLCQSLKLALKYG